MVIYSDMVSWCFLAFGVWKLAFKFFSGMESWDPSNGFLGSVPGRIWMLKRWNAKITMYKLGFFCNAVWESSHLFKIWPRNFTWIRDSINCMFSSWGMVGDLSDFSWDPCSRVVSKKMGRPMVSPFLLQVPINRKTQNFMGFSRGAHFPFSAPWSKADSGQVAFPALDQKGPIVIYRCCNFAQPLLSDMAAANLLNRPPLTRFKSCRVRQQGWCSCPQRSHWT